MKAWLLCGAFLSGVLSATQDLAIPIALVGLAVCFIFSRQRGVAVLVVAFTLGCWRGQPMAPGLSLQLIGHPPCTYEATVSERIGAMGVLLRVGGVACGGRSMTVDETVIVDEIDADAGTRLRIRADALPLGADDFGAARARTGAQVEIRPVETSVLEPPGPIMSTAAAFRDAMRNATSGVATDSAALLKGLAIGDTEGISPTDEESFRSSGLSHLVAVSGSNVAMVVSAAVLLARALGRIGRYVFAGLVLVMYVLVVGPEPSVLRAAIMGGLAIGAILSGRRTESLSALAWAVIGVVAMKPHLLASVGLHLSAAATAGIILWSEPLARFIPGPRWVALPIGVTLAAQIAVAPILAFTFAEVPLIAPVSNALAGPAVAPATVLALGAGVISLFSGWLGVIAMSLASPFATWILWVARWFGRAPVWHTSRTAAVVVTLLVAGLSINTLRSRNL